MIDACSPGRKESKNGTKALAAGTADILGPNKAQTGP